jgi:anaerobic magnesium-protoporphyrin IX monomethyl ester cyclase
MIPRVLLFYLSPGHEFPISLGYIAASLKKHNINTTLENLGVNKPKNHKQISNFILKFQPRIVGFSAYQCNIREVLAIANLIKKVNREIITIIGGPQATFMPKEALLEMPSIDVLCRGEGEVVLPSLSDCLNNGKDMEMVNNIAFKKNDILIETEQEEFKKELDDFPSPYRSGVFNFADHKFGVILTSRGCPFNCHFCYTPNAFRHTIRYHSSQRVLEDLNICIKNNIRYFFFADPSFTFNRERVVNMMRGVIKKRWKIKIWCETRTDLVDKEMLAIMAKAGVKKIAYGLETVDKHVMEAINKRIDLDNFKKVVTLTRSLGMEVEVFTIYGLPKQTYESARKTLEFLNSIKVKIIGNSSGQQLALYFGTKIYDSAKKFGMHFIEKKRPLFLSPGTEFETEYMDRQEIALINKHYQAERTVDRFLLNKVDRDKLSGRVSN